MTRKDKQTRRKKPGPKREFSEAMLAQVELLAKLGASNKQLSVFFDKDVTTIDNWIKYCPEFREARKRGGMYADLKVVESLYKRATGYDFIEEEIRQVGGRLMKIKKKVHIVPDVKAITVWLTNRQRELWANTKAIEHSGSINHIHNRLEDIPIEQLSPGAQELLFEITNQQLTDGTRSN